nr:hypothetical protein [Candidatus Cloacimonadota bacterium]
MNKQISIFILFILHFSFYIFHSSIAFAIEVGGHLTEDTIWSPVNNPYLVVHDVYVDDDVTLTILPGTEVKFAATELVEYDDFSKFIHYNGSNEGKMLWVDGKVIAEGTEDEPIIFTRIQDSLYYHWGVIYLRENADRCVFKYCDFSYSARMMILVGILPVGAISIYNEENIIENCNFYDNFGGVFMQFYPQQIIIKNCDFFNIQNLNINVAGYADGGIRISAGASDEAGVILVSGNRFSETHVSVFHLDVHHACLYAVYNDFIYQSGIDAGMHNEKSSYFFENDFIGCSDGIDGGGVGDSLFIQSNRFICAYNGIDINEGYVEISDNYFEGCGLTTEFATSGKVYNNILNNGAAYGPGQVDFFNNISYNNENGIGICATFQRLSCTNNLSINNLYAFEASESFDNCIFIGNDELEQFSVTGTPLFRNCITDFEIEYPLIDGGGNIIIDSMQTQSIFEDIQNGDFHLSPGSIAIDAGFDTLGYYYPFDLDYNHRVWDGDNNGTAIIDIGPYEYGAPSLGGIEGITY